MAPYELTTLHNLRRRGQCPKLPVFVTDVWDWRERLQDIGCLAIRVRNPADHEHDWSALRGMHCILLCNGHSMRCQHYEPLAWKLLEAKPSQLEAFYGDVQYGRSEPCYTSLIVGEQEPIDKIIQRDALLCRLLRHG